MAQGADQASVTRAIHSVAATTAGFMAYLRCGRCFPEARRYHASEQGYSAVLRNVKIGNAIV